VRAETLWSWIRQNSANCYILPRDVAQSAGFDVDLKRLQYATTDKMAMLPTAIWCGDVNAHKPPTLVVYDPMGKRR